uniref:Protein kinase domain-containing protein n=1 Tax=Aegilops tauschii subsp. strangulata TaxID=200361 RepID=A0A453T8L0_AEGTS
MANCLRRQSTTMPVTPRSEGDIRQQADLRSFAFKDLKEATMNFRPDSALGQGRSGSVFKGWVDETTFAPASRAAGMPIVVKILEQKDFQGHIDWLAEVNRLGQLSLPNLAKLLGYCLGDHYLLLVYEFIPQGSLENHLFGGSNLQSLSWDLRMKVALGAAKGLVFLHSDKANISYGDFRTSHREARFWTMVRPNLWSMPYDCPAFCMWIRVPFEFKNTD